MMMIIRTYHILRVLIIKFIMDTFDIDKYLANIKHEIKTTFKKPKTCVRLNDILLDTYFQEHCDEVNNALLIKQIQMKIGIIWQKIIGQYDGYTDLGIGHECGLDVITNTKHIIMEIKNRHNTDNSSARKANFDKLVRYKKKHPNFRCIYGVINDTTSVGTYKKIIHNDTQIEYMSGDILLNFIFGKNKKRIIKNIQEFINSVVH